MEEAPNLPPAHSHFPGSGAGEALTTDTDLSAGELLGEVALPMPQDPDSSVRIERTLLEAGVADGPVLVELVGDVQVGEHDREVSVVLTRGLVAWQSPEGRQLSRSALLHFHDLAPDGGVGPRRNVDVSGPERDSLVLEDPTAADHGLVVEWSWGDLFPLGPAPEESGGGCGPDDSVTDCCLLEITFICIPRETEDLEVSDVAATGELRVRVYRGVERGAELSVTCEPGEPVRGEEVTCRAETGPEDAGLAVQRWSFEGGGHQVEAERTQPTWQGRMVVSGTVTVTAAVAGEDTTASTEVAVQPREWRDPVPEVSTRVCDGGQPGCPFPVNPSERKDLAQSRLVPSNLERPLLNRLLRISTGPNAGWAYLRGQSAPIRFEKYEISLHSLLFEPEASFWRSRPQCDVDQVRRTALQHERVHTSSFINNLGINPVNQAVEDFTVFGISSEDVLGNLVEAEARSLRRVIAILSEQDHEPPQLFPPNSCDPGSCTAGVVAATHEVAFPLDLGSDRLGSRTVAFRR